MANAQYRVVGPFGESPWNATCIGLSGPFDESPWNATVYRVVGPFSESPWNATVYRVVGPFGESPWNATVYRVVDPYGESPWNATVYRDVDPFGESPWNATVHGECHSPRYVSWFWLETSSPLLNLVKNMSPHQAKGRARSLTGARGARVAHGARGDRDEGNNDNHHESVMGGGAHVFGKNVWVGGGAPPTVISGTEFMQGVFTAIEQVVRNTVQEMLVLARAADTRAQEQSQVRKPPTCFHCGQVGHIARQCTHRRNTVGASGPQTLGQKSQRTRGRTYAMTSVVGPSKTTGQQEQQLDASVVRGTLYTFKFVGLVDW
ncbi:hypothetical protein Acr_00g0069680 [Actinidia rufa]|uniref:CCHC-type domain-containing protein n=1 Tax=Actinidia rufa TaxID=165716 RepID=A0A7J0DRL2_9ERIC|nr:hypothetical protein Acr_00g0069680 [Actinidia rufa]